MEWGSFSNFIAMGGHGRFIWGSYGLTALVVVGELLMLRARRRRAVQAARAVTGSSS
jgi:heme exporter protein D